MYTFETAMAIWERIRSANRNRAEDEVRVPTISKLHLLYLNEIVPATERAEEYIRLLVDAHYLLTDKDHKSSPSLQEGSYVVSELEIVRDLLRWASQNLEIRFEEQFYRRYHINKVINEIFADPDKYRGSKIGRLLDLVLLLRQYEQTLLVNAEDYSVKWRQTKLKEMLAKLNRKEFRGQEAQELSVGMDPEHIRKTQINALEKKLKELQQEDSSGPWGELTRQYGIARLLDIHLRKREFSTIYLLLDRYKIAKEEYLLYLRDAMRKLSEEMPYRSDLKAYKNDIIKIKRASQMRLNHIRTLKKHKLALQQVQAS